MNQILNSIINERNGLLLKTEPKESIKDVLFLIEHSNQEVLSTNVYLLPYDKTDVKTKNKIIESIVSKISDSTFFIENNIDVSKSNLFILSSFDSTNCLDNHYIFQLDTGIKKLVVYNLDRKLILDKILENNWRLPFKPKKSQKLQFQYLFFDTETTGLPLNWNAPASDTENWPRLVQLAYLCFDDKGNKVLSGDYIIKPDNFKIPITVSKIHGITNERALQEGKPLKEVLDEFNSLINKAQTIVAHNISFDEKIISCEFIRNKMESDLFNKHQICTMKSTTKFCAINGPYGYKWPKLSELHYKLFNVNFEDAHNASIDIEITAKCFWELKRQNQL